MNATWTFSIIIAMAISGFIGGYEVRGWRDTAALKEQDDVQIVDLQKRDAASVKISQGFEDSSTTIATQTTFKTKEWNDARITTHLADCPLPPAGIGLLKAGPAASIAPSR